VTTKKIVPPPYFVITSFFGFTDILSIIIC
jgi:hypothetical protein